MSGDLIYLQLPYLITKTRTGEPDSRVLPGFNVTLYTGRASQLDLYRRRRLHVWGDTMWYEVLNTGRPLLAHSTGLGKQYLRYTGS